MSTIPIFVGVFMKSSFLFLLLPFALPLAI